MRGAGGDPGRAGGRAAAEPSGAAGVRPTGSGLSRDYYGMARPGLGEGGEGGQAVGIMGWRGLLRRGRESRDYYGMARPPATGGGQVGGREYYGMAGPPAAGGVLWDEDAPSGGGERATIMGWLGPAAAGARGARGVLWDGTIPSACDRATIMGCRCT